MKTYKDNAAKNDAIGFITVFALAGAAMALMTGCSGIGASAELYRIDEHQGSSKTYRQGIPLACYLWKSCGAPAADEPQGS